MSSLPVNNKFYRYLKDTKKVLVSAENVVKCKSWFLKRSLKIGVVLGEVKLTSHGKRFVLFFAGLLCLAFLFNFTSLKAQSSELKAKQLLEEGLALMDGAKFKKANGYIKKASALYLNSTNRVMAAHCYNHLSSNSRLMSNFSVAQQQAKKALSLLKGMELEDPTERIRAYTNLGLLAAIGAEYDRSLNLLKKASELVDDPAVSPVLKIVVISSLGYLYDDLGKYDQALYHYNRALDHLLAQPDPPEFRLAKLYNNLGVAYANKGLYKQARHFYRLELKTDLAVKGENHPDVAGAYLNIGNTYFRSGDVGEALIYFERASRVIKNAYGRNHSMMVIALNSLAKSEMRLGNYKKAVRYLDDAIEIKKALVGKNHPELAISYKNIAKAYAKVEEEQKAYNYYLEAIALQKKTLRKNHPDLAVTYNALANFLLKNEQSKTALTYLKKARTVLLSSVGGRHPNLAETFAAIGRAYAQQGKIVQSISFFQDALTITAPTFNGVKARENPKAEAVVYPAKAINVLLAKAEALHLLFKKRQDKSLLNASLYTYMALSKLLDKQQWGYNQLSSKIEIGRRSYRMYEQAIDAAYKMYEITGNRSYFRVIFYFSEKSKGRVLLEAVAHTNDKQFINIPEKLLKREQELKHHLAQVKQILFTVTDAETGRLISKEQLQDSLFVLNRKLAVFTRKLEKQYPKYHRLKYSSEFPSIYKIQKRLQKRDAVIVEYFYGLNSLYAIVISSQKVWVEPLVKMPSAGKVTKFRQAVISGGETYDELGYQLYSQLIKPLQPYLKSASSLLIVPGGPLRLLPFDALLTQKINLANNSYSSLPYLIKDYNLSYSTSIALNVAMASETNVNYDLQFVGFAPVFSDGNTRGISVKTREVEDSWETLPFSDYEVNTIASKFTKKASFWDFLPWTEGSSTKLFLSRKASENNFKSNGLLSARYIHLATHAFAADQLTQQTGIIFYQNKNNGNDDVLYTNEIYNLQLQTQLVVLSACETGIGAIIPGEGIMGLSRAFQYAGADNLIVSLWKVGDRSTAEFMISFYGNLKKGYSLPQALSATKRMMIRNQRYAHPRYWATFKLIGNGER